MRAQFFNSVASFLLMLMAAGIAMGQTKHNHCISINGRVVSCAGINNVSNGWRCYLNDWPESCKETMAFWHKLDSRQVMGGCRADTDYEVICNESKPTAEPLPLGPRPVERIEVEPGCPVPDKPTR